MLLHSLLLVLIFGLYASAQTFSTGDNSSVADCSHQCSHHDPTLFCLDGNAHFYERLIMGHMRYYIATQVSIDLWHKHHAKGEARRYNETYSEVREGLLLQWAGEKDIVDPEIIETVAGVVAEKTMEINLRNRTHAPPTHCPIPCEYTNSLVKTIMYLSMAFNVLLAVMVIVLYTRMSEKHNSHRLLTADDH